MQPQRPSSRIGAITSLVGTTLAMIGFFFPLVTRADMSQLLLIRSQWEILFRIDMMGPDSGFSPLGPIIFRGLLALILTLPLLSALIVLYTSFSACFKSPSFRLLVLRQIGAITGLSHQSLISIVMLSYLPASEHIGPGFILLLLGFSLAVAGAFLSRIPLPTSQQNSVAPSSRSSHIVAILSVVGIAVIIVGFFLPLFGKLGDPSAVSQWNLLISDRSPLSLPLVGALIVLGISLAALFHKLSPELFITRRVIAVISFFFQLLLYGLAYIFNAMAYRSAAPIGIGFGFPLIGFALLVIVAFFPRNVQTKLQEKAPSQLIKPE